MQLTCNCYVILVNKSSYTALLSKIHNYNGNMSGFGWKLINQQIMCDMVGNKTVLCFLLHLLITRFMDPPKYPTFVGFKWSLRRWTLLSKYAVEDFNVIKYDEQKLCTKMVWKIIVYRKETFQNRNKDVQYKRNDFRNTRKTK